MILGSDDPVAGELSLHEINAAIPRKVRIVPEDASTLFIFVGVIFAAGAIWLGCSYHSYSTHVSQTEALHRDGRELFATVTKRFTDHDVYLDYKFSVDGVDYQGEAKLPEGLRINASAGQPILIRYLPSNPTVNHPSAWDWSMGWDKVLNAFALAAVLLAMGGGVYGAVGLYRDRQLARFGWVVEGKVTGCAPRTGRYSGKFTVDYEFHSDDSALVEGSDDYSDDEYEAGSRIRVIYLRHHPKRNHTYPLSSIHAIE